MSFDKFLLAVESRDLSQADKSIIRVSSFPKLSLNDLQLYKKTIWHLAIWPGLQFFHVSHIRKITLIRCHSAVIPLQVFAVYT